MLVLLIIIFILCNYYSKIKEQFGCFFENQPNRLPPFAKNTAKQSVYNIPKNDYIHDRHPYYLLVQMFKKKIKNKKINVNQHNTKLIKLNKTNIDLATDYLIKFIEREMKKTYFLKQIKNEISYEVIDEFNEHYKKIYTVYDVLIQEEHKFDFFMLNIHIANTDIVSVNFVTTITTDSIDILPGTDNIYKDYHTAEWTSNNLI